MGNQLAFILLTRRIVFDVTVKRTYVENGKAEKRLYYFSKLI